MQRASMHVAKQAPAGASLGAASARHDAQKPRCDCAGPKAVFGDCPACAAERRARLQRHAAERAVSNTTREGSHQVALSGGAAGVQAQIDSRVGQGAPLPAATRDVMEPVLGTRLDGVRIHADAPAAAMNRTLRAQAFTYGRDVFFNAGRFDPGGARGRHLLAHELTHVVQQERGGRPAVQLRSELEDLPEAERRQVRVLRSQLGPEGQKTVDKLYSTPEEFGAQTLPAGMTLQFGTSVLKFRHKGLTLVAGSLVTPPDKTTPAFLPKNSVIDLAIPAAAAVFRFTRLDRPSSQKAGATGPVPEEVLIEEVGIIQPEPKPMWEMFPGPFSEAQGPLPQPEARRMRECLAEGAEIDVCRRIVLGVRAPGEPEPPPIMMNEDKVEIRGVKIKRGAGWNERDWRAASAALESLPDVTLKQAAGVSFLRAEKKVCAPDEVTAGTCDPNRAAETDSIKKTITVFNLAFAQSTTRFGMATELQFALAHEIGHLADYLPLGTAFAAFKKNKDEKKVLAARSRSGSAFVKQVIKGKNHYNVTEVGGAVTKGSFREAAIKDGLQVTDDNKKITGGGVTAYGETGWGELFPESFALYNTDPDLLKAIRPNIFAYFERTYPKQATP